MSALPTADSSKRSRQHVRGGDWGGDISQESRQGANSAPHSFLATAVPGNSGKARRDVGQQKGDKQEVVAPERYIHGNGRSTNTSRVALALSGNYVVIKLYCEETKERQTLQLRTCVFYVCGERRWPTILCFSLSLCLSVSLKP